MKKELKFYFCDVCKNVVVKAVDSNVPVSCCGKTMVELVPNTVDASAEKHVPVVTRENNTIKVSVGSVEHPMTEAHLINFIVLETENGYRMAYLNPNDKPEVVFYDDEPVVAVYAYCNLHGLWKVES